MSLTVAHKACSWWARAHGWHVPAPPATLFTGKKKQYWPYLGTYIHRSQSAPSYAAARPLFVICLKCKVNNVQCDWQLAKIGGKKIKTQLEFDWATTQHVSRKSQKCPLRYGSELAARLQKRLRTARQTFNSKQLLRGSKLFKCTFFFQG